jgi:hypothetical protein
VNTGKREASTEHSNRGRVGEGGGERDLHGEDGTVTFGTFGG